MTRWEPPSAGLRALAGRCLTRFRGAAFPGCRYTDPSVPGDGRDGCRLAAISQ